MPALITLPGIDGSGEDHWQSAWERDHPAIQRFSPSSWSAPELDDWSTALDAAVADAGGAPILVAHSLAGLLLAHWASGRHAPVAGAFVVAPPDPSGPDFPEAAASFRGPPMRPLGFPALLVASRDDPYASVEFARRAATAWDAGLVDVGNKGHVSGIGRWFQGRRLLEAFAAGLGLPDAFGSGGG